MLVWWECQLVFYCWVIRLDLEVRWRKLDSITLHNLAFSPSTDAVAPGARFGDQR
ncbi:MAG: hypothetical protein ACRDYE_12090 [Acidimicrobiales bacterium]